MFDPPKSQSQVSGAPQPPRPSVPLPSMPTQPRAPLQSPRPQASAQSRPAQMEPAKFDIPRGAAPKPKETESLIYTMPTEYYGVAPKTPIKKSAPSVPALKPTPPPKPASPKPAKPKKTAPIILIIGLVFLVVISVGGFLVLQSLKPAAQPIVNTVPPVSISICGNGVCESNETTTNCAADCIPNIPPPPPPPEPIRGGIDTDSDGLTDYEETIIYASNPRNADTDGDTFIDGNEVFNLYDPTLPAPNILSTSSLFRSESVNGIVFLVPQTWTREDSALGESIIFRTPQGENVELVIFDHEVGANLNAFFAEQFPGITGEPMRTKSGFAGLRNLDERKFAIETDTKFILINYNLGELRRVELLRTVEMVVNSIQIQ